MCFCNKKKKKFFFFFGEWACTLIKLYQKGTKQYFSASMCVICVEPYARQRVTKLPFVVHNILTFELNATRSFR